MSWKAISLWQPWASLWCSDWKVHETRHWPTSYRGPLLVHAAKRFERDFGGDPIEGICSEAFGAGWRKELPTGALVGIVDIVGCKRTQDLLSEWGCPPEPVPMGHWGDFQCGNFADGRFAWQRGEAFERFGTPVPFSGGRGFFHVPESVISEWQPPVPAQLALFGEAV